MSFSELVYRIGKRYTKERTLNPDNEFPYFSGTVADLVDPALVSELEELQGEYIIAYNNGQGTQHLIRVYFEDGCFEAEGTLPPSAVDGFSMNSAIDQ